MVIFDENTWCDWHYSDSDFTFVCPSCKRGQLREVKSKTRKDRAGSLLWHETGILTCDDPGCAEKVIFCREASKERRNSVRKNIVPLFFVPPLPIFTGQTDNLPYCVDVHEPIISNLFWIDPSSCGNAIRRFLEDLLTDLGVRKKKKTGGGFQTLNLHARIREFSQSYPKHGKWLESVKWIGNTGTHELSLDVDEVVFCLKVLRNVLNHFYFAKDEEQEIESRSSEVNRRKRP
jgi:hypothetical protein